MQIDLQHLVKLARIDLAPEEEARIRPQMQEFLKYVDKLNELDVGGIKPMAHAAPLTNVMRNDEVLSSLSRDDVLRHAPRHANGLFMVPKIVE
jgi:aspartyl-tRNA(Asn)/glutamyl-tRNA(Gln) amidotransferase subunit C